MLSRPAAVSLSLSLALLASCGAQAPAPAPSAVTPELETAQGFIRPVQVRVYEVGTHTLVNRSGETQFFLASGVVDLGAHVGEEVEVRGISTSLGSGSDRLLSVRELRTIGAAADGTEAIDAAKRLARTFDPPYAFLASDASEVVSASAISGITVVRISQEQGAYLVKLVRKPDPVTGEWEIFAIEKEASAIPSLPSGTSSLPTGASSLPSSVSAAPSAAPIGSAGVASSLAASLPSFLAGTSFAATSTATKIEVSDRNRAYIAFTDGTTPGMVLVGWTSDPAKATVLATFVQGDTTDWKKETGDNVARSDALTVYAPKAGAWTPQQTTKQGYALYASTPYKFSLQYPKQWYYAPLAKDEGDIARVGFSSSPVTPENALVTLRIVPGAAESYATKLSPTTIGGATAYQGTLNTGTEAIVLTRDAKTSYLLTATGEGAAQLAAMAATLQKQ